MQPKRPQAYFSLSSESKVCYHNGMPLRQCQSQTENFLFRTEKLGENIIQAAEQKKIYEGFGSNFLTDPFLTIFSSHPTDEDALEAASSLLRNYIRLGLTANFLFVNQDDSPPRDPEQVQDIYILMGVNHTAPCDWVRRWIRSRLGVPIWVCLTAPKPVEWYRDCLGIKPGFLFSLKGSAKTLG